MAKKFVQIHSNINIRVTPGLQLSNYTDEKALVPNKLNVKPRWQKAAILIKQGAHWYPAEIANWNTVKTLIEKKVMTLGQYSDNPDEEEAVQAEKQLDKAKKEFEKPKSLKEVSED